MSFEPVTRWALRCDGEVPSGQCPTLEHWTPEDADEDEPVVALRLKPGLTESDHVWLRRGREGWTLLPDGTVLCPQHMAAREQMVAAALEGLPFEAAAPTPQET